MNSNLAKSARGLASRSQRTDDRGDDAGSGYRRV